MTNVVQLINVVAATIHHPTLVLLQHDGMGQMTGQSWSLVITVEACNILPYMCLHTF